MTSIAPTNRTSRRSAIKTIAAAIVGTGMSSDQRLLESAAADDVPAKPQERAVSGNVAAATVHPLATESAIKSFERGGNAFDAAIAAAFMLGVVDGHNSGIGGGCFILARTADGKCLAIDGRETAPALAHRDMYRRGGAVDSAASKVGALASGVPGQVAALSLLNSQHGRLGWADGLRDAAQVASDGFELSSSNISAIRRASDSLRLFPSSRMAFLRGGGSVPELGSTLQQPDLARSLTSLADEGAEWFYRGPFASACDTWMKDNGGVLRRVDFADYAAKSRPPLVTRYRDWQVIGFPPPSSGGIHIAQMLMMLEPYDIKAIFDDTPSVAAHLLAEVMKRAFADRAYWLGDSDHADVPIGLIDREYCRRLASTIDLTRSTAVASHGQPPNAAVDLFSRQHTTHLTTADADGNWVAITNTINTTFGSCVVIPGTGVVMNNEMDDFSIAAGTPNAFGLIGAEANSIAPGKRPLSSMSPTIIVDGQGNPRLTCGAAGGPRIISAVLQCILGVLDRGLSVDDALAAPRLHHQWAPDRLLMEPQWDQGVINDVRGYGHTLAEPAHVAVAQAIERSPRGGLRSASDPRL